MSCMSCCTHGVEHLSRWELAWPSGVEVKLMKQCVASADSSQAFHQHHSIPMVIGCCAFLCGSREHRDRMAAAAHTCKCLTENSAHGKDTMYDAEPPEFEPHQTSGSSKRSLGHKVVSGKLIQR